jgi:hypothetical protein
MSDEPTIKELLGAMLQVLVDIREALVVDMAESNECEHPEARRVSLSTPSDPDHWVCLDCKVDNKRDTAMH